MRIVFLRLVVALPLLFVTLHPVLAAEVIPADVYAEVQVLHHEVDRVRFHMGAPEVTPLMLKIVDAQPHDVYFLALTLYEKSSRLLFQVTRKSRQIPDTSSEVYLPADVLKLVLAARDNLSMVMQFLDLPAVDRISAFQSADTRQPSDVFVAILAVNRQINALLDRRFSPSDVFEEITLAINYGAILLAQYEDVVRIPEAPDVEPGRVPSDVYQRLLSGLEKIKLLYNMEGLESLVVDPAGLSSESITPSDVLDIASLLVARLDYLHKRKSLARQPRESFYPGTVYPTDVYRQAGILLLQLDTLLSQTDRG